MKQVQFPRGTTEQEDAILGAPGQVRVDTTRNELRLHDGVTLGGHRVPTERTVQGLIAQSNSGGAGKLQLFATEAELQAAVPSPTTVALCLEGGLESWFVWSAGVGDQTSLPSSVSGSWTRLTSGITAVMLLWRAGFVNLLVDSVPPITDQALTVWIDGNAVLLWDGSEYVPATPVLFCAMLAEIGGYATGSFSLPDQLQAAAVVTADANTADDAGWYYGTATTTNRPADVVFHLSVFVRDSNNILQTAYEVAGNRVWVRRKIASAWGAWALWESLIGVLDASKIPNLAASKITSGTLDVARIPDLAATKITSGVFDVARIPDLPTSKITGLASEIATAAVPAGAVMYFAMDSAPTGWLEANGAAVSRATYAALFAAVGTVFGAGNGTTTFNVPELRGEFIRGWDNGRGVDAARTFGSAQADAFKSHTHTGTTASSGAHTHTGTTSSDSHTHNVAIGPGGGGATDYGSNLIADGGQSTPGGVSYAANTSSDSHSHTFTTASNGAHTHTFTTAATGDSETRPRNIALLACIKY